MMAHNKERHMEVQLSANASELTPEMKERVAAIHRLGEKAGENALRALMLETGRLFVVVLRHDRVQDAKAYLQNESREISLLAVGPVFRSCSSISDNFAIHYSDHGVEDGGQDEVGVRITTDDDFITPYYSLIMRSGESVRFRAAWENQDIFYAMSTFATREEAEAFVRKEKTKNGTPEDTTIGLYYRE